MSMDTTVPLAARLPVSSDPAPLGDGRRTASTLALCIVAMVAEGFDTYAVGYVGPAISKDWGLTQSAVGALYAIGVVASLIGSIALGFAADRFGRKTLLTGSCLLFGCATLLGAAAPSVTWLFASRAFAGIGLGASIPCAMALAVESAAPRWRTSMPIFLSAMIGAGSLVAGLSAAAVMPAWGWRGLLALGGALPILIAPAMPFLLRESLTVPAHRISVPVSQFLTRAIFPRFAAVTLALLAIYGVTFFLGFWLPTLLHGITPDIRTIGLAMALVKSCSLAGSLIIGFLVARLGAGRTLPVAAVLAALAVALLAGRSDSLTGAVVGFGIASFFLDASFSGAISLGAIVFPSRLRATGIGVTIGVARLAGGTAGPMLGGILLDRHFGLAAISFAFALPLLAAAALIALAMRLPEAPEG